RPRGRPPSSNPPSPCGNRTCSTRSRACRRTARPEVWWPAQALERPPRARRIRVDSSLSPRSSARPGAAAQLPQGPFVADDQQRLRRRSQQIEKRAAGGTRVDFASVDEQLHRFAAAGRIVQPLSELVAQNLQQLVELMDR